MSGDSTASQAWRVELRKHHVWYAAFGSNLLKDRFRCYIAGGQVEGMSKSCPGSPVDKTFPKDDDILWKAYPHRLFFGRKSETWDHKGVAFLDPRKSHDEKAHMRLYKITLEQFNDVLRQENGRSPGDKTGLLNLEDRAKFVRDGKGSKTVFTIGWYRNVVCLGVEGGIPVLTITCTKSDVKKFILGEIPLNPPSEIYKRTLVKGLVEGTLLVEGKQISKDDAFAYVEGASSKPLKVSNFNLLCASPCC